MEPARSGGKWDSLTCFVGSDMEYGRRAIGIFLSQGLKIAAICGKTAAIIREDLAADWDVGDVPVFISKRPWRDEDFLRFLDGHPTTLGIGAGLDYIVSAELLKRLPIVNGHPAILPFHRGCHHSFWGIVEKTKFGASLHWMEAELDAGPVIAQRSFEDDGEMVAGAIQKRSNDLCLELFGEEIQAIMAGDRPGTPQPPGEGCYHAKADIVGASTLHSGDTIEVDRLYDLCRATNAKNNGFIIAKGGRRFMIRISAIDKL